MARAGWAGDPPQRGAARERLLAAAEVCLERSGLANLGITAVAAEAGVSRPTVYRYFEDRRALVQATLLRAAERFVTVVHERLAPLDSAGDRAVEVVVASVRAIPGDRLLGALWAQGPLDESAVQGFTDGPAIALSREALGPLVDAAGWDDAEADEAIEVILRFIVSLLASPAPERTDHELRGFLRRRLVPALGLGGAHEEGG